MCIYIVYLELTILIRGSSEGASLTPHLTQVWVLLAQNELLLSMYGLQSRFQVMRGKIQFGD